MNGPEVKALIESLAGQDTPFEQIPTETTLFSGEDGALGYSQLNELLLLYGFDRVSRSFFRFLLDGDTTYTNGLAFENADQLRKGVERFRRLAILFYGNVKFAFKILSQDEAELKAILDSLEPIDDEEFALRHRPVLAITDISSDDAYLTGYLIERELKKVLDANPEDENARNLDTHRKEIVERAKVNHDAYLASDHLDVYVATSMRQRHEFSAIKRLTEDIFGHESLRDLQIRWFDPTQAYCADRIDKGLSEALMLRRAACTIYLAQESDTLGKDSELASTLAQGKPVVAFVPKATDEFIEKHLDAVQQAHPNQSRVEVLLGQLRVFEPDAAWTDSDVQRWCDQPESANEQALKDRLLIKVKERYDGRATTLMESHPLGIQVNLDTGVANGVLVVRTVDQCAQLTRNILTRRLDLDLDEVDGYTALRERISGCIFRVMTHDKMLTNSFWNFYLDPVG